MFEMSPVFCVTGHLPHQQVCRSCLSSVLTAAMTRAYSRITAVDGHSTPSTVLDRDLTCANAGDRLNLALVDVRTWLNLEYVMHVSQRAIVLRSASTATCT